VRDLIAAERIRLLSLRATHYFLTLSLLIAVAAACLLSAKLNIRPMDRASYPSLHNVFNADIGGLLMTIDLANSSSPEATHWDTVHDDPVPCLGGPGRERVACGVTKGRVPGDGCGSRTSGSPGRVRCRAQLLPRGCGRGSRPAAERPRQAC
jgi:hypothetical protein